MSDCYGSLEMKARPCPKCGGIMSLTFDGSADVIVEQCCEKKCTYSERYKNRRKQNIPVENDRRKLR